MPRLFRRLRGAVTAQPSRSPLDTSSRGQSLVEFALVLPMLLVLLLGVADFGRVFSAGITIEASARNGAEAAAQEYLQIRRSSTPPGPADYDRLRDVAFEAVCDEAVGLPNRVGMGASCVMPAVAICLHDDATELPGYVDCGTTTTSPPPECGAFGGASMVPGNTSGGLPWVEVKVCYRFDTLFHLEDVHLPFSNGLSLGTVWLTKDRAFVVGDYP